MKVKDFRSTLRLNKINVFIIMVTQPTSGHCHFTTITKKVEMRVTVLEEEKAQFLHSIFNNNCSICTTKIINFPNVYIYNSHRVLHKSNFYQAMRNANAGMVK